MAGAGRRATVGRQVKTAIVRSVVPRAARDAVAGVQLYGKALETGMRGFPSTAEKMKTKAGKWALGDRVEGGPGGNFSGHNSIRGPQHGAMTHDTWPPHVSQETADISASVARNAAGAKTIAERSLASTIMGDFLAAAPKALKVAGRLAGPAAIVLTAADLTSGAIRGGLKASEKGGDALDIAGGAAWGGLNAATLDQADAISYDIAATGSIAAGLQKWAGDVGTDVLKTFGFGTGAAGGKSAPAGKSAPRRGPAPPVAASPGHPAPSGKMGKASSFEAANKQYAARQAQANGAAPSADTPSPGAAGHSGNTNKGTRNESNLKAIIANRQAKAAQAQGE